MVSFGAYLLFFCCCCWGLKDCKCCDFVPVFGEVVLQSGGIAGCFGIVPVVDWLGRLAGWVVVGVISFRLV